MWREVRNSLRRDNTRHACATELCAIRRVRGSWRSWMCLVVKRAYRIIEQYTSPLLSSSPSIPPKILHNNMRVTNRRITFIKRNVSYGVIDSLLAPICLAVYRYRSVHIYAQHKYVCIYDQARSASVPFSPSQMLHIHYCACISYIIRVYIDNIQSDTGQRPNNICG